MLDCVLNVDGKTNEVQIENRPSVRVNESLEGNVWKVVGEAFWEPIKMNGEGWQGTKDVTVGCGEETWELSNAYLEESSIHYSHARIK